MSLQTSGGVAGLLVVVLHCHPGIREFVVSPLRALGPASLFRDGEALAALLGLSVSTPYSFPLVLIKHFTKTWGFLSIAGLFHRASTSEITARHLWCFADVLRFPLAWNCC